MSIRSSNITSENDSESRSIAVTQFQRVRSRTRREGSCSSATRIKTGSPEDDTFTTFVRIPGESLPTNV